MLDFSSALYLGMHHPSRSLRPWDTLTFGVPAALKEPEVSAEVAQKLAELQGCEKAVLAPSTLHLFWDLFGILGKDDMVIYMDTGVYPIARWGVERAASRGVIVRTFPHHNADALSDMLKHDSNYRKRPLILSDGFCPSCGRPAPVSDYLSIAEAFGGNLILDDTQALGIFGHSMGKDNPYGIGGGGILQWSSNTMNPRVLMISSMAKGFGVPVAVLSGSNPVIKQFKEQSKIRVHCSPPSAAVVHAAGHALALNRKFGDKLRRRLLRLVGYFRNLMSKAGLLLKGGIFPVQTLSGLEFYDTAKLYEQLLRYGVQTVLHRGRVANRALISFLINARHRLRNIDYLVNTLIESTKNQNMEVGYEIRA